MAHPSRRFLPHAIVASVVALALLAGAGLAVAAPLPGPDNFNSPGFIVQHAWVKFAYQAVAPFRHDLSEQQQSERVARYFELNGQIAQQEQTAGDPASDAEAVARANDELRVLYPQRDAIENSVEVILEGRLTRVIKETGLTRQAGGSFVWPPVNIAFQHPPAVLVTSPRATIRKEGESLLQGELPIAKVESIERKAESDGKTSAVVIDISGIAMYPAIIPRSDDYEGTMEDIAHEWTHQYLFFTPLGRRYFENGELTTLNETVANIVGQEMGARLAQEYPLPAPKSAPAPAPAPQQPALDFNSTMHNLRLRVDALLAQGKIDEAEGDMEQTREQLAAAGYYIRKINQAYFAFQGSYANTPGSSDPIGPKLTALRKDSATLEAFVHRAQALTSESDLDQALVSAP